MWDFHLFQTYIILIAPQIAEEKMLHEELHLKWEELLRLFWDQQLFLDSLRPHLVVGVSDVCQICLSV